MIHHPKQEVEWTSGQSEKEKWDYMKVDLWGEVSVTLQMADISAEGSFKYLSDTKVDLYHLSWVKYKSNLNIISSLDTP